MQTVNYHITAISCNHCIMTIKRELGALEGVSSVEGDAQSKNISVAFQAPATPTAIESLLEEIGYPVQK
jgi:copper chaperone